eukprot:g23611.t1
MTLWALSSEIPAGIVAPSLVIGGLLGRIYAHVLLPEWFLDMLLATDNATPSELQKGAFMARCAIFGASAFCCAVEPFVDGCPLRISPENTVKDAYLLMKMAESDRGQTKLLDLWLELRHSWVDALDEGEDLALGSGIHQLFRSKSSREVQQQYLDLYKQLDNLIKFLSMVAHYRRLANIAGDAAMYHLRSTLHHLLQEIEIAVANTLALVFGALVMTVGVMLW